MKAGPALYAGTTLVVAALAVAVAMRSGVGSTPVTVGVATAWVLQAMAFAALWRALASGRRVVGVWVGGIAARVVGIPALWTTARLGGHSGGRVVASYALALVVFLLMEAGWLAARGGLAGRAAEQHPRRTSPGQDR